MKIILDGKSFEYYSQVDIAALSLLLFFGGLFCYWLFRRKRETMKTKCSYCGSYVDELTALKCRVKDNKDYSEDTRIILNTLIDKIIKLTEDQYKHR